MNKEENTLTIETYLSWKNKRFAVKDFIKESLKELEDYKSRIEELEEENKRLKCCMQDTYDSANDICGELQQKIDKAIEYIKNKAIKNCWLDQYESCELIKILKGSEE